MLSALHRAGWDARQADLIVGTSIGAVTAGLLRAGMAPDDLVARVGRTPLSDAGAALVARAGGWPELPDPPGARWWPPASPQLLATLARHPGRVRPGLLLAGLTRVGTVDTAPITAGLDHLVPSWPAGTSICAVDLDSGRRRTFSGAGGAGGAGGSGGVDFGRAVAASCAVPTYFAPVAIDGRRYVDGGVHSPSNTDLVATVDPRRDAVVVSLPMGLAGWPGRRGIDLPGRWANTAGAMAGLRPLTDAGVPVLVAAPTASELEVMHYDAFDVTHTVEVAARISATVGARLGASPVAGVLGLRP